MPQHLNSVKTRSTYHHGDLRAALLKGAEAVLAERGADGFSLRETARRAGVSPAAPAHHFGDARGLLTAVAAQAFADLADAIEGAEVGAAGREDRLRAQGRAYVAFALANRARFDLMWRRALLDCEDPAYLEAGGRAFGLLDQAVRGAGAVVSDKHDPALAPTFACWAMVHGFARLAMDGVFGAEPDAAERAADALLPAVLTHLQV